MSDIRGGVVDEVVDVGRFELGQLRVAGGAVEQDRRQRIGEVIGDEAVGPVVFARGPVAVGKVAIGDRVAQSVVEAVIDRGQQSAFRSEVVVERPVLSPVRRVSPLSSKAPFPSTSSARAASISC